MEVARWIAFQVYSQNPYIKPPRVHSVKAYCPFPWEGPTEEEEAREAAARCHVTDEEKAQLNSIFARLNQEREEKNG
jgi:hypothetical protein